MAKRQFYRAFKRIHLLSWRSSVLLRELQKPRSSRELRNLRKGKQ